MFYSQFFLTKKGALATIWVAAHSQQKLKKEQIKQTNIPNSVDKILVDVPVVTYRILGYLLLGVVRIYSKKVDYLFHDSTNVLTEIRHFSVRKSDIANVDTMRAPHASITLPESFELDAFDIEVFEGGFGGNVKSREEITLQDDQSEKQRTGQHSFDKFSLDDDNVEFEDGSAFYTSLENIEPDGLFASPLENVSDLETSMENILGNTFSVDESVNPPIVGENEEEIDLVRSFDQVNYTDETQPVVSEIMSEENEDYVDDMNSFDEEQYSSPKSPVTTPESNVPHTPGGATPEIMAVHTPAAKERSRIFQKQKCLFDEAIVIRNKECKHAIYDSSDLLRKRKKVGYISNIRQKFFEPLIPCATPKFRSVRTRAAKERSRIFQKQTCLLDDVTVISNKECKQSIYDSSDLLRKRRKIEQMSNLPQKLFEPLISSFSNDLESLISQKKLKISERVEVLRTPTKTDLLKSMNIQSSPDQETIAPSTPATRSTSRQFEDNHWSPYSDCVGPANSFNGVDKEPSPNKDREVDVTSMNEEFNFGTGDDQENDDWSIRTREFMRYLHERFLTRKKRGEDEVLNLSQPLQGKSKKESATLFYVLLVLKNRGYVIVRQDTAYDDIFVTGTPKLQQACEADSTQSS